MSVPWTPDRLLEAAADLCNGQLSDADGMRLDQWLASDVQARRLYINYMWLHSCLYAENGSLHRNEEAKASASESLASGSIEHPGGRASSGGLRSWTWATAAAVLVAVGASWATYKLATEPRLADGQSAIADQNAATPQGAVVARITGTHNCIWRDPRQAIGYGSKLVAGQRIEIAEGLAEITFNDGATVLLEGPATFDLWAPGKVALVAGRLAAVVPQEARGFRVHTQSLDVVEVGAEFGLVAQESGAAEVHVFNGLMKADVLDPAGRSLRRLELNAAEAARINPLSTTVTEFPADDAMFVRNLLPSSGPQDGLLAYEGFRYPDGPLEAQNGGFGWAGPWFTTSAEEEGGPDSNRVRAGSLAIEGIVPAGNRALLEEQRNRIRRQLATSVGGVFDAAGLVENQDEVRLVGRDGKRAYISFLQRVNRTGDGFYGVEFHRGDGNGNRVLCIGNGADGAGYGATSNTNVYGAQNLPALGEETTDVNFFVIKMTFGAENRDVAEVFRNPESLRDEGACRPDAVLRGNFAFDRISLANFDGMKSHEVDEIRVGTHFLAVTGRWGNNQGRMNQQVAGSAIGSQPSAIGQRGKQGSGFRVQGRDVVSPPQLTSDHGPRATVFHLAER